MTNVDTCTCNKLPIFDVISSFFYVVMLDFLLKVDLTPESTCNEKILTSKKAAFKRMRVAIKEFWRKTQQASFKILC